MTKIYVLPQLYVVIVKCNVVFKNDKALNFKYTKQHTSNYNGNEIYANACTTTCQLSLTYH